MTTALTKKDMVDFFSKEILPLFDQLLLGQHQLQTDVSQLQTDVTQLKGDMDQMIDFKNRQLTFNDALIKKVENLEIEYFAIRHQLEEYDNFFHDPSIPEEKKKAAYKVMVIKIQALENELNKVKRALKIV